MTRRVLSVVALLTLPLGLPISAARADPIRITGGSLEFNNTLGSGQFQGGRVSIVGNRGFSATGIVDSIEVPIEPIRHCYPCQPASTIPLDASFAGTTVTLDGQTYTDVNGFFTEELMEVAISGTIDLPPWRDAAVTISAPFEAAGDFHRSFPPSFFFLIRGSGRATLSLTPEDFGGFRTWFLADLRYDFVSTPTPEPATLTLLTGGLVASGLRARKRRDVPEFNRRRHAPCAHRVV